MANAILDAIYANKVKHNVGTINTSWAKEYANGAVLTGGNADNYTLVEFDGFDEEGNRKVKPLTANTVKGHIVSTVEEEDIYRAIDAGLSANYTDFYNKEGDMVKVTISEPFLRYEVSNFEFNTGITVAARGQVAHYDATKKKYIISSASTPHAGYTAAVNKYIVVDPDTDFGYNIEVPCVRLEIQ